MAAGYRGGAGLWAGGRGLIRARARCSSSGQQSMRKGFRARRREKSSAWRRYGGPPRARHAPYAIMLGAARIRRASVFLGTARVSQTVFPRTGPGPEGGLRPVKGSRCENISVPSW